VNGPFLGSSVAGSGSRWDGRWEMGDRRKGRLGRWRGLRFPMSDKGTIAAGAMRGNGHIISLEFSSNSGLWCWRRQCSQWPSPSKTGVGAQGGDMCCLWTGGRPPTVGPVLESAGAPS